MRQMGSSTREPLTEAMLSKAPDAWETELHTLPLKS